MKRMVRAFGHEKAPGVGAYCIRPTAPGRNRSEKCAWAEAWTTGRLKVSSMGTRGSRPVAPLAGTTPATAGRSVVNRQDVAGAARGGPSAGRRAGVRRTVVG